MLHAKKQHATLKSWEEPGGEATTSFHIFQFHPYLSATMYIHVHVHVYVCIIIHITPVSVIPELSYHRGCAISRAEGVCELDWPPNGSPKQSLSSPAP